MFVNNRGGQLSNNVMYLILIIYFSGGKEIVFVHNLHVPFCIKKMK